MKPAARAAYSRFVTAMATTADNQPRRVGRGTGTMRLELMAGSLTTSARSLPWRLGKEHTDR